MTDIICTVPWHCGEKDCPVGWHLSNYWAQEDGSYTVDTYADGDHEDIEEADVPRDAVIAGAWEDYRVSVHETGEDPLHNYRVEHTYKRKACYEVRLRNSIVGPVVREWRRGRKPWAPPSSMPLDLASYLCMTGYKDGTCEEVVSTRGRIIKSQDRRDDGRWSNNYFRWEEYMDLVKADEDVTYHMGRRNRLVLHLTLIETVDRTPGAIARDLRRITQEKKS